MEKLVDSRYCYSHASHIYAFDGHAGRRPHCRRRRRPSSLFLVFEHQETEASAVSRVYPVSSNEPSRSLHFGQDILSERGGRGWRLRGVDPEMN